jgi:hypothetical protein
MKKNSFVWLILSLCLLATYGCTDAIVQSSQKPYNIHENVIGPNTLGYFLPKGVIRLSIKESTGALTLTIETKYIPDPNHFYTLNYRPNAGYDDDINITLDANGMLSDINVTTTDKSVAIVGKLLEIAKEVAKIPLALPIKGKAEAFPLIDTIIDPDIFLDHDQTKIDKLITELSPYIDKIYLTPQDQGVAKIEEPSPQNGIYYRPLLPYELTLIGKKPSFDFTKKEIIYLPNRSPILSLDVRRGPFIQKVSHLKFTNGILTEIHITKPSEVLAALDIPLSIVKAIISLPTDLIQFKIDYSSKQEALVQQLQSQLEAERALRKSQSSPQ